MGKTRLILLTTILGLFCFQRAASGVYINSSFRDQNVFDGYFLHMARSFDGYCWTAFNDDEPLLMPAPDQGSAMRDTSILRGPDNRYHMVWTSTPTAFGYSSSPDLVHWTPQQLVPLCEQIPNAQNTWAPELFYDEGRSEYLILWSVSDDGLDNQRIYSTTTTDFQTFTPTQKFFDPGYSVIDAAIIQNGSQYTMVFKDERSTVKRLKMVTANDITPGAFAGHTISDLPTMAYKYIEGPQPIKIGDYYYVYYDHYNDGGGHDQYYGALRSSDLTDWTDVSNQMVFPDGTRHGCVFEASNEAFFKLLALPGSPPLTNCGFESSMNGIFDIWDYGENSTYISNGSIVRSTDSVISGNASAKIGYEYGQIKQVVTTDPTWQFDMDFSLLEGSTRALGVNLYVDVEGSEVGTERIVMKSQEGHIYLAGGPDAVSGWSDLGLANALETSGSAWNGQDPIVNHLIVNGYFDAETPYYTVTLNGETSDPITYWLYGVGTVISGSTINVVCLAGAWSGGSGDVNCWLADDVSLENIDLLPGDANHDGYVDADDAAILAEHWQQNTDAAWRHGDFNYDGKVNDIDATLMAANWHPQTISVPEPVASALLTGLIIALLRCFARSPFGHNSTNIGR